MRPRSYICIFCTISLVEYDQVCTMKINCHQYGNGSETHKTHKTPNEARFQCEKGKLTSFVVVDQDTHSGVNCLVKNH